MLSREATDEERHADSYGPGQDAAKKHSTGKVLLRPTVQGGSATTDETPQQRMKPRDNGGIPATTGEAISVLGWKN